MPALFAPSSTGASNEIVPLAQLSAGVDGSAILAKKGEQLLELLQLTIDDDARWAALEARLRIAGSVDHPGIRAVFGVDSVAHTVILEGERSPPLAELVEQQVDLLRVMKILGELSRAVAAAHHVGLVHGKLDPWAVHVGAGDRPRIELTGLDIRPANHEWTQRCIAPEARDAPPDPAPDVFAIGALLQIFATT